MTRASFAILFALAVLAAPAARAQDSSATLIRNATILTVSHGTIENGSILIRNGKISAVGKNLKAPKGAKVIDANGQFVMPSIIDCH
jgi:imidazolonepropionase-like amidohydrolase